MFIFLLYEMFTCVIFALKSEYHLALLGYLLFTDCLFKGFNEIYP